MQYTQFQIDYVRKFSYVKSIAKIADYLKLKPDDIRNIYDALLSSNSATTDDPYYRLEEEWYAI